MAPSIHHRADGIAALKLDRIIMPARRNFFAKDVGSGTGIRLYHGVLYASSVSTVYASKLDKNLVLPRKPEIVLDGMPKGGFNNRVLAFDNAGNFYVDVGGTGNTCTGATPKGQKPMGLIPCRACRIAAASGSSRPTS